MKRAILCGILLAAALARPLAAWGLDAEPPATLEEAEAVAEKAGEAGEPADAKPISARSIAHLYEIMSREPPLSRQEVLFYEENLPAIVSLGDDPGGLEAILEATGWNQRRFTYVVAKIGAGLSGLAFPDNPRLRGAPDFLMPTSAEAELIVERLEALVKGFHDLSKEKPGKARGKGNG